jgi:hypothetical protein
MTINFDILSVFMKNGICNDLNGTCIVSIKWGWLCSWKSKFSQKTTKPNYLWTSSTHDTLLRFSRRFRVSHLFRTFPWVQRRAKKHVPTNDRASSIRASCPICITISTQIRRISNGKEHVVMRASLQVTNYTTTVANWRCRGECMI